MTSPMLPEDTGFVEPWCDGRLSLTLASGIFIDGKQRSNQQEAARQVPCRRLEPREGTHACGSQYVGSMKFRREA